MTDYTNEHIESYESWKEKYQDPPETGELSKLNRCFNACLKEVNYVDQYFLNDSMGDPLSDLKGYIDFGYYPPPEILLRITECFTEYYRCAGKLTLEEVFFGKPEKNSRNCASRIHKNFYGREFAFYLAIQKEPEKSLIKNAEKFVYENQLDIDPESVIRAYKRSTKKRNPDS